jgi:predicted O-methyltransferase YrrM
MRQCATTLESELTVEERKLLLGLLKRENFCGPHLEVGTAAGGTLCQMMLCFNDDQRPQFVAVDRMTYFPDQLAIVQRNLKQRGLDPDQVDFRVTTSAQAFQDAASKRESFDFILIDASHKILGVMADLRWSRLLSAGGILCLHDYSPRFPGVRLPVDRFLAQHTNYSILEQAGTLLALRKSESSRHPEVTALDRAYSMMWYLPLEAQRKINKWKGRKQHAARAA